MKGDILLSQKEAHRNARGGKWRPRTPGESADA